MLPFHECYTNSETVVGVVADRYYGVFNGEDTMETYWTLRRQAVSYDVPEKPWQIEGLNALAFLEKIFSCHIDNLAEGRGRYAIACTDSGGAFMDGILFKMAENCHWYVQHRWCLKPCLIAHSAGLTLWCQTRKVGYCRYRV
ncbi:MAG: glycine cleavage system aminomethyltransferase T [Granulosicoccus sp.]|jgi:glycine cleavage system aminomethyltransferase T